jgi:pyruvate dehydrogenase (quinone)
VLVARRSNSRGPLSGINGFQFVLGKQDVQLCGRNFVAPIVGNGLIRLEAESMGMPAWKAMDFRNPDYVALARACGAVGFKAEKPGELREAIDQGLKADGPAIIDCVVPANELPNVPHVELEKVVNVAEAKIKEAILAVTGG